MMIKGPNNEESISSRVSSPQIFQEKKNRKQISIVQDSLAEGWLLEQQIYHHSFDGQPFPPAIVLFID